MSEQDLLISKAISWWENELNDAQRDLFLNGYVWSGSIEERHSKLLSFYDARTKSSSMKNTKLR